MRVDLLDHGYLEFIESWGSDERIIEAARMSTDKGFRTWSPYQECKRCAEWRLYGGDAPPCVDDGEHDWRDVPRGDAGLLRYLYEHKHATPFEFAGLVIEVQAPIMVFREWHRHRTQCLAGDTAINLVTPNGTTFKRTIQQLFELKHGGVIDSAPERTGNGRSKAGTPATRVARRKDAWRVRVLPNCQNRTLRTFDEETRTYRLGSMRDVWESGAKELWAVATDAGTVRASAQHPFLTRSGWAKVSDIRRGEMIATSGRVATQDRPIPPSLRQGIGARTSMMRSRLIAARDACYICGEEFARNDLELDHVIPVFLDLTQALNVANLKPACVPCHNRKIATEQPSRRGKSALGLRWATVLTDPQRVAEEMTYDLEMVGPDHNYVANGLVVHNSYNELSARYTPLPNVNYSPAAARCLMVSGANKQAGVVKGADELTHESALEWLDELHDVYEHAERVYQSGLRRGIPKEVARLPVPVGRYSRMRACANLRNWLAFLTLRMAPNAQWEIRQYANAVGDVIAKTFPRTWELFAASKTA